MGKLVKLIGSGIGLAAEAYQHRKNSSSQNTRSLSDPSVEAGPSTAAPMQRRDSPLDSPPTYAEVTDSQADQLIMAGKAVPADSKDEKSYLRESQRNEYEDEYSDSESSSEADEDEREWELDEAVTPPPYSETAEEDLSALIRDVHPTSATVRTGRLPLPVIIPQRRPGTKTRGFIRAYAPVLNDVGIDQTTFLRFLKSFHSASQADPWISAVMVSAGIAGMAPSVIAMAVTTAVQIAAGTARELQGRYRTNAFLDAMNKELFMPRGVFAMVVKYKPDDPSSPFGQSGAVGQGRGRVDERTAEAIAKYGGSPEGEQGLREKLKKIRLNSAEARGEIEMPECAPLVFPSLDELADQAAIQGENSQAAQGFKAKMKSSQKFVASYMDKRAQATYAAQNPDSTLAAAAGPQSNFFSRYADPNHPAVNNGLVGLVTGGALAPRDSKNNWRAAKSERKASRQEWKNERRVARGRSPREYRGSRQQDQYGRRMPRQKKGIRRFLKEDVMYLMIVNMPSEEELRFAREEMARGKDKGVEAGRVHV